MRKMKRIKNLNNINLMENIDILSNKVYNKVILNEARK